MGMGWPQQLDVRVDGRLLKRFTIGGNAPGRPAAASYAGDGEPGFAGRPSGKRSCSSPATLACRCASRSTAGSRIVGVSFVRRAVRARGPAAAAAARPRADERPDLHGEREHRLGADRRSVHGQRHGEGHASRRAIFVCQPASAADERAARRRSCRALARLAYRRPVAPADVKTLLTFFDAGVRDGGSFDAGIQFALERMLVDPDFLLRVYRDPSRRTPRPRPYRLSDLELASRLSFFLWSSLPDDRLLDLAERASCRSRRCSTRRCAACSPIRKRRGRARATTSPRSG